MNHQVLKIVSLVALALTIVPSFLFLKDIVTQSTVTMVALIGTVIWFAATPLWMERGSE